VAIGVIFHDRIDAGAGDAAGVPQRQVHADGEVLVRRFFRRRLAIDLATQDRPIRPISAVAQPLSLRRSRANPDAGEGDGQNRERAPRPSCGTCRWSSAGEMGIAHGPA